MAADLNTTKAKDAPELEFKKPGETNADGTRDLNRVTSYNNITPMVDDYPSDDQLKQEKEIKKPNQVEQLDDHAKDLIEQVMGVSPTSDASYNTGNLHAQSEGYFPGLKMDPSGPTSTDNLNNTQPLLSPTSAQSPLSQNPIKISYGEKPTEIDQINADNFDHVNVVGPKSPLSVDSAI